MAHGAMDSIISCVLLAKILAGRRPALRIPVYGLEIYVRQAHRVKKAFVSVTDGHKYAAYLYWREPFDGHQACLMALSMDFMNPSLVVVHTGPDNHFVDLSDPNAFNKIFSFIDSALEEAAEGQFWYHKDPLEVAKRRSQARSEVRKRYAERRKQRDNLRTNNPC